MAQVAIALQNRAGAPAEIAMTRPAADPDEVEVLYGYESEEIGLEAGEVARAVILELIAPRDGERPDIAEAIDDFDHFAGRRSLGPSALALVRAAEARDIPWMRLNDASLIQVGQGKYQKRIEAALTSQTSHTAVEIASDKELCTRLLSDLGLPVPQPVPRPRRRGRRRRRQRHRLPGRGEAGRRQPRPRRLGEPHHRRRGRRRLRDAPSTRARASSSRA